MEIRHYDPDTVIQGLLDSEDYNNRVAGSCIYHCPHCGRGIRFRWKNFYKADARSFLKSAIRQRFDAIKRQATDDDEGFLDFHCLTCHAPTRIIFAIHDYTELAYHFDIRAVYIGERNPQK